MKFHVAAGLTLWILAASTFGQEIRELEIALDPAVDQVRPLESLTVQARAYGFVPDPDHEGQELRVRVRMQQCRFRILEERGGWLSKPFRFQGDEAEAFYEKTESSLTELILGRAGDRFLRQDSVLYTAPDAAGTYTIEAVSGDFSTRKTIRVDPRARTLRGAEKTRFPQQQADSVQYRLLAEHYAPFIAQATWFDPKADYLARFDFDGDWIGENNWDATPVGSSQAYVHYGVAETETHWFLIYAFFHPRDYSDNCVAGTCHENDCEGMILTVLKDGSSFGKLQVMETLAHNNVYSYRFDNRVRKGAHGFDGRVELYQDSHPVIFVESGGHGVYSAAGRQSIYDFDQDLFAVGTGVTYLFRGRAERPRHPDDRLVGYDLISISDQWWAHFANGSLSGAAMFDDFFDYTPFGDGRPDTSEAVIPGSFRGKRYGTNKAKPIWAWHDRSMLKKRLVAVGQWGLDPAYSVSRHLKFPKPFSLNYLSNEYLGVGRNGTPRDGTRGGRDTDAQVPPTTGRTGEFLAEQVAATSRPTAGSFNLRLQVDQVLELEVRGHRVFYRVARGRSPVNMGCAYTLALPGGEAKRISLSHLSGRGKVLLLEQPTRENGFAVRLRIEDPGRGSDLYVIRLDWQP